MNPPERLYHASSVQGLTAIVPTTSTHGAWVHAVADPVLAACFLSTIGGDLTCAVGRDQQTGTPYVCERFEGALDRRYAGKPGSIYKLAGEGFLASQTPWEEELVSSEPVVVLEELCIDDSVAHLRSLAAVGRLLLVRYPSRIDGIPDDDSDLIERAVRWRRRFGEGVLDEFGTYHPHLLPRIRAAIAQRAATSESRR